MFWWNGQSLTWRLQWFHRFYVWKTPFGSTSVLAEISVTNWNLLFWWNALLDSSRRIWMLHCRTIQTYDRLREAILQYDQATIKWSNTMALGSSLPNSHASNDDPIPMDVDRIWKGKGYGKGKGKSKDGKGKGKDKSGGKYDKASRKNQHKGSWNNSWGSGKGKWNQSNASNSDKGGKSSSKGKGHGGKDKIVCWKCNKVGDMAQECRVRLIEEENGDAGNSQSHECSGAASSSGGTKNASNNASSSRVSRISLHNSLSSSDDISQLYFDLSSLSDFSKFDVKMISETCSSHWVASSHDGVSSLFPGGASMMCVSAYGLETMPGVELCCDDVLHYDEFAYLDDERMEYVEKFNCDSSEASLFELCTRSRSDDFKHFISRVSDDFSFHMYDVVCSDGGALSAIRRFDDFARFQPSCNFNEVLIQDVRAVKACCGITLDSGFWCSSDSCVNDFSRKGVRGSVFISSRCSRRSNCNRRCSRHLHQFDYSWW